MKINSLILSIPPYISISWEQVAYLEVDLNQNLIIHLINGKDVTIPHLTNEVIGIIFREHAKYIERSKVPVPHKSEENNKNNLFHQIFGLSPEQLGAMPIRFGISAPGMEGVDVMQHNQSQASSPDMPKEVIDKIVSIAKMVCGGDLASFPKPEAHCNCSHCQVARAVHGIEKIKDKGDETVTDEDLTFRTWDIVKIGDHLYQVTNPLDMKESYNVYLGSPIGCTCGHAHCEHLRAVLSS